MDAATVELAESLVTPRYIRSGAESVRHFQGVVRSLIAQRRCPDEGLPDSAIELLLHQFALMDSNNFAHHVGGGEREGRVVSALVRRRCFGMTHGIGRSGDLTADQPKAAGSSLVYQLTNALVLDFLRMAGVTSTQGALVVPMATGMTLALALRSVAKQREQEDAQALNEERQKDKDKEASHGVTLSATSEGQPLMPRYVLWTRIDQKTALKCIEAAGLKPYPIPLDPAPLRRTHRRAFRQKKDNSQAEKGTKGDAAAATHPFFVCSRVERLEEAMEAVGGRAHVLCVLSTTSCFSPRLPDDVLAIARFCRAHNIAHVVNNAYGVQSRVIMNRLEAAQRLGRVDYVVQSGDKNFLVPVGGAVLSSPSKPKLHAAAAIYAGRASAAPAIDLFITCLSLGRRGMQALWKERYVVRALLEAELSVFAAARGETLVGELDRATAEGGPAHATASHADVFPDLDTLPRNDISFAITMKHYGESTPTQQPTHTHTSGDAAVDRIAEAKAFGAKLFRSAVTGPRVVFPAPEVTQTIAGCTFRSYGVHQDTPAYDHALLVVACGVGMTQEDVVGLMERLSTLWPHPPRV